MSLKWPPKDPQEVLDFTVDWTDFLGTDEIQSVAWFVIDSQGVRTAFNYRDEVDTLVNMQQTHNSKQATIYLGGGTSGSQYEIICNITTLVGNIAERTVRLPVRHL